MPLCSLYNTFNQKNPNEIAVSNRASKTTIYCVLFFNLILYSVFYNEHTKSGTFCGLYAYFCALEKAIA